MGVADLPRTAGRFQTEQVADFTEIRNIIIDGNFMANTACLGSRYFNTKANDGTVTDGKDKLPNICSGQDICEQLRKIVCPMETPTRR